MQIPYYISSDAKDLLIRLLRKNPNVRLGHGDDGMEKIKNHRFFRKIDWKDLKARTSTPPIQPIVVGFFFNVDMSIQSLTHSSF